MVHWSGKDQSEKPAHVWLGSMKVQDTDAARRNAAGAIGSMEGSESLRREIYRDCMIHWIDWDEPKDPIVEQYYELGIATRTLYEDMKKARELDNPRIDTSGPELNYTPYPRPARSGLVDLDSNDWRNCRTIPERIEYIARFRERYRIKGSAKAAIRRDHSSLNSSNGKSEVGQKRLAATYALCRSIDKTAQTIADILDDPTMSDEHNLSIGNWPNPYLDPGFTEIDGRLRPPLGKNPVLSKEEIPF